MSLSQPSPAKRARIDEDSESSAPTRSDVWHSDGSVVLQASNKQFRVHWGVLTMHSSVFKDLYSVPQPDLPGPMVDGCPVVELHDDPEPLAHFLRALYNPALFSQKTLSFDVLAALIRLGRKYDCQELRKASVERLISEFPTTASAYEAFREQDLVSPLSLTSSSTTLYDAIQLLKEQHLLSALPVAYFCSHITTRRPRLAQMRIVSGLFSRPREGWPMRDSGAAAYIPRMFAADLFAKKFAHCPECAEEVRDSVSAGRERAWNDLPSMFGLPSWEELQASDEI
uniref:BTB domain-containing protein n=1 Tax=Mycena chlorophos TaxID=658473 RepID=A0ABQ0M3N3_MYCCL|nr:predicted protein [Mycena chlorophos]